MGRVANNFGTGATSSEHFFVRNDTGVYSREQCEWPTNVNAMEEAEEGISKDGEPEEKHTREEDEVTEEDVEHIGLFNALRSLTSNQTLYRTAEWEPSPFSNR